MEKMEKMDYIFSVYLRGYIEDINNGF